MERGTTFVSNLKNIDMLPVFFEPGEDLLMIKLISDTLRHINKKRLRRLLPLWRDPSIDLQVVDR